VDAGSIPAASTNSAVGLGRHRPLQTQAIAWVFSFPPPPPLVLAKYFSTEAAFENAREAMRIHGRYGCDNLR